jgi:hypothetical protein
MARADLTAEQVRELFDYDQQTGNLIWRDNKSGGVMAGQVAGCINARGYRRIRVDQVEYKAHRLVWLHVNGEWPSKQIDHINRNPGDNRIENLRDVTASENLKNRRRWAAAKAT